MSSDGKCQLGTACVFSQSIPDVSDEGFARRIVGFEYRASQRRTCHVTQQSVTTAKIKTDALALSPQVLLPKIRYAGTCRSPTPR
jgi:hypothetical protein